MQLILSSRHIAASCAALALSLSASAQFGPEQDASGYDSNAGPFVPNSLTWTSHRPDGHAPIGVMGEHTHGAGDWMLSYRYMRMEMDGNLDGTDSVSSADIFAAGFQVAPKSMTMDMHMLGAMVGVTDRLTLMGMLTYLDQRMEHVTAGGTEFTTASDGPGDSRLAALYRLWGSGDTQLLFNGGLSLPTGSIDERDDVPASGGADVQLPYPMQLGSGTFDLQPGLTWLTQHGDWSFGAQGQYTARLGRNDNDYRLGDRTDLTAWVSRRVATDFSVSARLAGAHWEDISGADPALNPAVVPTADPDRRGGDRIDALLGLNYYSHDTGHRLAIEFGVPAYQDLNGPQLETDWIATLGWQYAR